MIPPTANQILERMEQLTADRDSLRSHRDADEGIRTMFDVLDGSIAALKWVLEGGEMFDPEDEGTADTLLHEANKRLLGRIADGG